MAGKAGKVKRKPIVADKRDKSEQGDFIHAIAQSINSSIKGDNLLMIGDQHEEMNVPYWVRTYLPALDYAVGGYNHPGFPGGRIIEIYGAEGSGKSTLCVWLAKRATEQMDTFVFYQDAERVLTEEIIEGTGIDMNRVIYQQPDTLEEVFEAQQAMMDTLSEQETKRPVITALDSVAACSTKSEIEGGYGDSTMGIHARILSQAMRKIKAPIMDNQVMSLFVNQVRDKMNVSWGPKTDTFGGKALKFYASVRIELVRIGNLTRGESKEPYGCTIQATLYKNKVAPPMKRATFDILFIEDDEGHSYPQLDCIGNMLDWCKNNKLIGGSTGRYEFVEGKSWYKEQARNYIKEHPEEMERLIAMSYSVDTEALKKKGSKKSEED